MSEDLPANAYKPWADQVIAVPSPKLIHSAEVQEGIRDVVQECKPKIIITHNTVTWEPDHRYIAETVPSAATRVFYEQVMRNELEIWGGDAEWEGPIANEPNVYVKIKKEDLEAKIEMFKSQASPAWQKNHMGVQVKHFNNWCRVLAKWRAHCIFKEDELYEAYVSFRAISII